MDKTNFDVWLNKRQQQVNENMAKRLWDRLRGTPPPAPPADPTPPPPEPAIKKPGDIYGNADVQEYTQNVLNILGIKAGMEVIDNKGNTVGSYDGHIPPAINQALMRFIAGHIHGGGDKTSFLWVSYHDAAVIVDWLDSLRQPGQKLSVAEQFHVEDPKSLALWIQTKLPMHQDARYQDGYKSSADSYGRQRKEKKAGRPSLLEYPELIEVVKSMLHFVGEVNKRNDIRNPRNKLHAPLLHLVDAFKKAFPGDPTVASMSVSSIAPSLPDPSGGGGGDPDRLGPIHPTS